MDDEKIQALIGQFLTLEAQVARIRASVLVLRGIAAMGLNPSDPTEGLRQLQTLEDQMLNADPNNQARLKTAEIFEAAKIWKDGGKHEGQLTQGSLQR